MTTTEALKKTTLMRMLEQQYGADIRQIVVDAYNRNGTVEKAAEMLGVSAATLQAWIGDFGIVLRTVAEIPQ